MGMITTLMESYCTIYRPTIGRDASGGVTQDYQPINGTDVNPVACTVQEASGRVQELYAQRNIFISTTVIFGEDVGIQANDKIVATNTLTGYVEQLLVQGYNRSDTRGIVWTAQTERIAQPS